MKTLQKLTTFILLLVSAVTFAQKENVFLERSFWKGDPNLETVKKHIKEGNDPTAFNTNAFDGVVYALLENANSDVVKHLLDQQGNPVDKRTHDSRIYLHWAAYAGNTEMVKTLLERGSSVTALDSHGNTPLTFAAGAGQLNPKVYELFIENGVDLVEEKNEEGANVLLLVAPFLENEEQLTYFTEKGLLLNSTDPQGNGIFNYAAKKGNIDFLKLLVKKGVDYKTLNNEGGNAFLFAAQGSRGYSNPLAVYTYLKTIGLEPNIVTKKGGSPLHRLAYNTTDPAILNFFLSAGADVNQKDMDKNTPFLNAASRNSLDMVKLLAERVSNFNGANVKGETALMLAVKGNSPEVTEFLLKKGSNAQAKDSSGNTLAYYLVESFNAKKIEEFEKKATMLQKNGVVFNEVQAEGNTLYHLAAKANDLSLLKKLSEYNIPVNAKNNEGLTALHLAAMKAKDDAMLKYLIALNADTTIKTDFEESVYDLASENELLTKNKTSLNFLK
ncbi:ankyrin repeat domain-containing protein [Cochleicola gelatinilyticus]|uniref:Uncharacterized protein n=1 Tax=Cochleicola gelatinilyticus TaxID=1763537 RepID=A0A167IP74_9FLAO|nr:ankyrin repeat domain-containing protein [Cochleicola gelatinilyticus]OAB79868.1 hypothetical protein ULVI_03775 [Cochleicola gelatinilyticus]